MRTKTDNVCCLNFPLPCKQSWSFNLWPSGSVSYPSVQSLSPYGRCRSNEDMVSHLVPSKWLGVGEIESRGGHKQDGSWAKAWGAVCWGSRGLKREWLPLSNTWLNPRLFFFFFARINVELVRVMLVYYATELKAFVFYFCVRGFFFVCVEHWLLL